MRARRQTRPEAVHLTVQSAFTLWGLPDCSEQAEALARLADQGDHITKLVSDLETDLPALPLNGDLPTSSALGGANRQHRTSPPVRDWT